MVKNEVVLISEKELMGGTSSCRMKEEGKGIFLAGTLRCLIKSLAVVMCWTPHP